jgi:hypothetical protein
MKELRLRTHSYEELSTTGKEEVLMMFEVLGDLIKYLGGKDDEDGRNRELIEIAEQARHQYKKALFYIKQTTPSTLKQNRKHIIEAVRIANNLTEQLDVKGEIYE